MNKILAGMAVLVAAIFAASNASAFSIALDIPFAYEVDDGGSADEVSGFKLGLGIITFPVLDLGVGYESYEITEDAGIDDLTAQFDIFDVFVDIPFPVVNIVLGMGFGEMDFELLTVSESADVSQAYVSLGLPFTPLFDVHVGWHAVSVDTIDLSSLGGDPEADLSGTMWSLGAKLGF